MKSKTCITCTKIRIRPCKGNLRLFSEAYAFDPSSLKETLGFLLILPLSFVERFVSDGFVEWLVSDGLVERFVSDGLDRQEISLCILLNKNVLRTIS